MDEKLLLTAAYLVVLGVTGCSETASYSGQPGLSTGLRSFAPSPGMSSGAGAIDDYLKLGKLHKALYENTRPDELYFTAEGMPDIRLAQSLAAERCLGFAAQVMRNQSDCQLIAVDNERLATPLRVKINASDQQVHVTGEATVPVAIPYLDHMTLLDVMIATKGLTKYAAGNQAVIVRVDPDGKRRSINVKLTDLIKDGDISQNIEMQPGDTLFIPRSLF